MESPLLGSWQKMTSQLSWQPPMPAPVTRCGKCPHIYSEEGAAFVMRLVCNLAPCTPANAGRELYEQNKDGITESCPMYQQQKASLDANKEVKPCEQ